MKLKNASILMHFQFSPFRGVEANYIALHVSVQSLLKPMVILKKLRMDPNHVTFMSYHYFVH